MTKTRNRNFFRDVIIVMNKDVYYLYQMNVGNVIGALMSRPTTYKSLF